MLPLLGANGWLWWSQEGLNLARGQNGQFIWVESGKDNQNTRKGRNGKFAMVAIFWVLSNQEIHFGWQM
jgi:hypothetical protein